MYRKHLNQMTLKRRQYTREFKLQLIQEADSGKS